MNREFTVTLKNPEPAPQSRGKKLWNAINDIIKSPLVVFIFGVGVATVLPAITDFFTSAGEKQFRRNQEITRSDAAMVAPFLDNLNDSEPSKFNASRAALKALAQATRKEDEKEFRPIFAAVMSTIDTVSQNIQPPPSKGTAAAQVSTTVVEPKIDASDNQTNIAGRLQDVLVYIQKGNDGTQDALASQLMAELKQNTITAPGIEKLEVGLMPVKTQIRYFNETDKSKAQDLGALLRLKHPDLQIDVVKTDLPTVKVKGGTLEIWLGKKN